MMGAFSCCCWLQFFSALNLPTVHVNCSSMNELDVCPTSGSLGTMESGFNWSLDDNKYGHYVLRWHSPLSSLAIYKCGMLLHIHPNSANFKTAPRMKQPYFTRKMSLLPFKFIWVFAMLLITEQVSPAHSLELTTDRKFVFNFFRYFPQIRNQLSDQCLAVSNYFRNHSSDDWASKSKFF